MDSRSADEVLYDSAAMLRMVDGALEDLRTPELEVSALSAAAGEMAAILRQPLVLADLPGFLLRVYTELTSVLQRLRHSRDVLEQATVEKLHQTSSKLREVSSATELAATDMLDGLDRALAALDQLDAEEDSSTERAAALRGDLRNELFGLMNCLQFQDITTQQLNYASSVLVEMEQRLGDLARLFDPTGISVGAAGNSAPPPPTVAFDPAATTADSEQRQALVDEIFKKT